MDFNERSKITTLDELKEKMYIEDAMLKGDIDSKFYHTLKEIERVDKESKAYAISLVSQTNTQLTNLIYQIDNVWYRRLSRKLKNIFKRRFL